MNERGFTLLEMMFVCSIMSVVSLLSFVAVRGSLEAATMTEAKSDVQSNLRNVMTVVSSELQEAITDRNIKALIAPINAKAVKVAANGKSITFMRIEPVNTPQRVELSGEITYYFHNEDTDADGRLDTGEDKNGDGLLNRRIMRVEDGEETVVGAVNDISNITFTLPADPAPNQDFHTTLRIKVESSRRYGANSEYIVPGQVETRLRLKN